MESELNRQAKLPYRETEWTSYGSMTFIQAAKLHARLNDTSGDFGRGDTFEVAVRCTSTPDDVAYFKMKRRVAYDVLNPRQGA